MQENPATTGGTGNILEVLHKYVPQDGDRFVKIPTNGDALSVERHISAQLHLSGSDQYPHGRRLGLEPVPQEFHHRGIYLQVLVCYIFFGGYKSDELPNFLLVKNICKLLCTMI